MKTNKELEEELKLFWDVKHFNFTAIYSEANDNPRFVSVRNPKNGFQLFFPNGRPVTIKVKYATHEVGKTYKINCILPHSDFREKSNIDYMLWLDVKYQLPVLLKSDPKELVNSIFKEYTEATPRLKEALEGAIKRIANDINKKPETFIYELLQNANDYPNPETGVVDIQFEISSNHLLLKHNGLTFSDENVDSICKAGAGDKAYDRSKIGYKGIGFKSIFKLSDYVLINSGGFRFRFDEYFFLKKGLRTFWQIIPIWTEKEEVPISFQDPKFFESPVSIAIRPKTEYSLSGLADTIQSVFRDERILLFMENVNSVSLGRGTNNIFRIEKGTENWEISDLASVKVPKEMTEYLNRKIKANDVVPEKFEDIFITKITFACKKVEGTIQPVPDAKVYVYLPTEVQLGFPFLINGDFIPDGGRQLIHGDLDWNLFLFKEAGKAYISWLKELWLKFNSSSIISLIPDFGHLLKEANGDTADFIQQFIDGVYAGISEIAFIPDLTGKQVLLLDLLVDETGISTLIGERLFNEIREKDHPIMNPSFAIKPIMDWMGGNEYGFIFDFENLKEIVKNDKFKDWLSIPENNLIFLKTYQFHDLVSLDVILDSKGRLQSNRRIYFDLGKDADLLEWMDVPVLDLSISGSFQIGALAVLEYTPISFVENFVIPNKSEIDAKLDDPENCRKFYQFLYNHHQTLPDNLFEKEKLSNFKFIDVFGSVRNSFHTQGQSVYFSEASVTELVIKEAVPADKFALLSPETYGMETSQSIDFWKKFQVKDLRNENWKPFLNKEIVGKRSDFEKHFVAESPSYPDKAIASNGRLWIFLHSLKDKIPTNEWKALCTDIETLPVFTAGGDLKSLYETYLSSVYTGNNALELLAERFTEIEVDFISEGYINDTSLKPKQWRNLFQEFNAKSDEKQLLQDYIIPELSSLTEEEIVPTTRLIFENGITENLKELRVKTTSGNYLPVSETLVGPPYLDADYWNKTLQSFPLVHVISADYLSGNNAEKWKDFFVHCGANTIVNQSDLLSLQILEAIKKPKWSEVNDQTKEASCQLIQELFEIHDQNLLTEDHYTSLRQLPALSCSIHGDWEFSAVESLWLGSGYSPRFDLKSALREETSNEFFLDDLYISESVSSKKAKEFFLKIGAFEDFEVRQMASIKRKEAPSNYIAFIDSLNSSIAYNAQAYNGTYVYQHSISPWKYLLFSEYLLYPRISFVFWKKFISNKSFREKILENSQYNWYTSNVTPVVNPVLCRLLTITSLPVGDGSSCLPTSQTTSFTFRQFTEDNSATSCIDFANLSFGDLTIEQWLKMKWEPDLANILHAISYINNYEKLRELGFWNKLKEILLAAKAALSPEGASALESFKVGGFLPNQYKQLTEIQNLYYLQAGLKLGLGSHPNLLLKELEEIAPLLDLRELTEDDFNPTFHNSREDKEFKSRLIRHLGLVAFAESEDNWSSLQVEYQEAINPILFHTVSEIQFSFTEINPPIQNTEKTFYYKAENVFYVGNWNGPWSNELFRYLHKILGLKGLSVKTFTDLLLFEISDIIQLFAKKNISVPEELLPATTTSPSSEESIAKEKEEDYNSKASMTETPAEKQEINLRISETEISELESLLGKNLGSNEKENANLIALFRCIKYCQKNNYRINTSSNSIDEAIDLRFIKTTMPSGEKVNVMFRSARGKLLHLNYSAWFDLGKNNTWLFVITGNAEEEFKLFISQHGLSEVSKDAWVMKVGGEEKLEDLSKLILGNYSIEGNQFDARVQFLIRLGTQDFQSIFEKLPQIGSEW